MKKVLLVLGMVGLFIGVGYSQLNDLANLNVVDINHTGPDSTRPYLDDQGVRTVWVANDLDQDGKPEILATDYSNNGRVHALELNGDNLEIVWSSPITAMQDGGGSTPRWVRSGDLDGDGKGEIIFPLNNTKKVQVWEWDGSTDNGYVLAIELPQDAFAAQGVGNFRMNREVGSVYDFDGDGADELIMTNYDNHTYILGISGDVPGFGGWQLEGGSATDPTVGNGSVWHSVPADINGDGQIDIVNHYWNFWAFWSIEPTGANTYEYPDTSKADHYIEFRKSWGQDAVSYMGIQPLDVDGDGKDEVAGILYGGNYGNYSVGLISMPQGSDPLYSWDSTHYAMLGTELWKQVAGKDAGSFWGIGAADLNNNGRDELLLGGSTGYNIVSLEYKGTGSVLDSNSYDRTIAYTGPTTDVTFATTDIWDSLGTIDTVRAETDFISKLYAGSDINGNGKPEVVAAYQSVYDSLTINYRSWHDTTWVKDSTVMKFNPKQINVRLLESSITGLHDLGVKLVTPEDYKLEQNYPNPFNPTTNIKFTLPVDKNISLKVYDMLGKEVKTIIANQNYSKGSYSVTWDGTNNFGKNVASGQYIYTLKYGNFTKSMKMTLLK